MIQQDERADSVGVPVRQQASYAEIANIFSLSLCAKTTILFHKYGDDLQTFGLLHLPEFRSMCQPLLKQGHHFSADNLCGA